MPFRLFPGRRLDDGTAVRTRSQLIQYLLEKHGDVADSSCQLQHGKVPGLAGANDALWSVDQMLSVK